MLNKALTYLKSREALKWIYPIFITLLAVLWAVYVSFGDFKGWFYLALAAFFFFVFRPKSYLHKPTVEGLEWVKIPCVIVTAIITIAVCITPMDKIPLWNGENPQWRDQYEVMAESILEGRLDIDCCECESLSALENPYDRKARQEAGVDFFHKDASGNSHAHWDHAYYNGHLYMYFGVVPVFIAFLPYRVITGQPLTTYKATQLFVALAVIGIFMLFYRLSKTFFKKLPFLVYLSASVAFSVMSVWYSTVEPALYCTPIVAAIALEVWSIYFFVWAVYGGHKENTQIVLAAIGALFGALAFGCRPPIAIVNIVVLPMLITFIKQRKFTVKVLGKLALAALPYVIIGVLLMLYNYARFNDPFEFGQAYQLTVADQSNYSVELNKESLLRLVNEGASSFFSIKKFELTSPYVTGAGGVFFNFPVLLLCVLVFRSSVAKNLKEKKLLGVVVALLISVFIITAMDILWSPYLLERYHLDIYFILGIAVFFLVGAWHDAADDINKGRICTLFIALSVCAIISANLLCLDTFGPEKLELVKQK